jgi:para-aminobenzoate synthetase/4-amino-4-deoxychorismate lyase
MIVDLLRNDLGKLARPGSVRVNELLTLETYPTFHTLTSTVTAELPPATGLGELFRALFPCGSVTGAPKVSTMRLIRELEPTPQRRLLRSHRLPQTRRRRAFQRPIRTLVLKRTVPSTASAAASPGTRGQQPSMTNSPSRQLSSRPPTGLRACSRRSSGDGRQLARLGRHLARAAASAAFFGRPLDRGLLEARLRTHALQHPAPPGVSGCSSRRRARFTSRAARSKRRANRWSWL